MSKYVVYGEYNVGKQSVVRNIVAFCDDETLEETVEKLEQNNQGVHTGFIVAEQGVN